MTPKEKAKELVMKFENLVTTWDYYNDEPLKLKYKMRSMKQCALICVEEMLDCNTTSVYYEEDFEYWKKVKQEINKL